MNKLFQGSTVYHITERFDKGYGFHIAKCHVASVPKENFKQYKLWTYDKPIKVYWLERRYIFDIYEDAVKEAEQKANKYDATWVKIGCEPVVRYWESDKQLSLSDFMEMQNDNTANT